jgi:hypothetical protein
MHQGEFNASMVSTLLVDVAVNGAALAALAMCLIIHDQMSSPISAEPGCGLRLAVFEVF